MKTPVAVLEEIAAFKRLGDIPEALLVEAADVLSSYAANLRREVMRRNAGGGKRYTGPDLKPQRKEKKR
jgi:hypothetical protein